MQSPHNKVRLNSRLPPSSYRAQSSRPSSRAQSAPLSYRAHSAKVQWEAAHGEACPYACAYPRVPAKRKRKRGPATPMHYNSNTRHAGVLPTGAPSARSQYHGFGKGFYKNLGILTAQHTANVEREATGEYRSISGAGHASSATGAAGSRWQKEVNDTKRGGGVDVKVRHNRGRRRRVAPTLLELHQRAIDAALLEISRPREGPFENLGERLGGEHETFTYYSQDGDGGSEGSSTELTTCEPASLSEATSLKRRASTATGRHRTLMRTRYLPRPSTGPRFTALTADGSRQIDLPRCNEPWKIPLLRTSWTPSNKSFTGDPFGDVEYDLPGSEFSRSENEGPTGGAAGSIEHAVPPCTADGASTHLDDAKEQSVGKILRPCAEMTASSPAVSHIAASQYVGEMVSKALLSPLRAADPILSEEVMEQAQSESDALSRDGASAVGRPVSRTAAKRYVDQTVSHALRGAFLAVSGKTSLAMKAAETIQKDGAPPKDQATILELKTMAPENSGENLRGELQAKQVGGSGEGVSRPQTHLDAGTVCICPPETNGHLLSDNVIPVLAQSDAFGKGCHISGESGATTPTSDITSRMSSDSSSIEFVLNDDSSAGTRLGDEMQVDHRDVAGVGSSCSLVTSQALTSAATAAVESWVSRVVSETAFATSRQTSAGVPSSNSVQGTRDAACNDQPPACHTDIPEDSRSNHHPHYPPGMAMKTLPLGFLRDIVERRASLKPVVASRPTSASVEDDKRLESDSWQQRERCAQQEAAERASALRDLESLTRAEGLDTYDPGAFSRGALYGEGRHSVVYSAYAAGPCEKGGKKEHEDARGGASTAETIRQATAVTMARETVVEALTMAVAAGVAAEAAVPSVPTTPMVVSTAFIESVLTVSILAVVATTKTVLAAKEFRYARADVPVSVLRKAHREVSMHLRVSGCTHVVALRGAWLAPRVTLLLEPMGGGNLHRFVRHRPAEEQAWDGETAGKRGEHDRRRPCTPAEAAYLVAEAAEGLAKLHSAGVVHRDVKSHNVMVVKRQEGIAESTTFMSGWEAKLGDLGSATLVPPEGHAALTDETGTSGWMAPEVRKLVV